MKAKTALAIAIASYLLLCIISATAQSPLYLGYGTPDRAKNLVGCLLGLINRIYPYVMLALIVIGAIKWIASGEDKTERLMAKKYFEMALIGAACIIGLMATATYLGIPPRNDCSYEMTPPDPAVSRSGLITPAPAETLTGNNL